MNTDRSWIKLPMSSDIYKHGVQVFLAFSNSDDDLILCPCKKCKNGICRERKIVETHLLTRGFLEGYKKWVVHGELSLNSGLGRLDNMHELISDTFGALDGENYAGDASLDEDQTPNAEAAKFYKILGDAEQDLYPGCKTFSKLSFIVRMLQIKCLGKWSDKSFSMMFDLLRESFPEGVQLPKNYYEAKKALKSLGLHYQKIDSCKNDCMIYWGANESKTKCDTCNEQRWKFQETNAEDVGASKKQKENKVAIKTFWHFPLKPRLQRLFMTSRTASLMTWHAKERIKDGIMRHPAGSPAWQTFDYKYPEFSEEPRNVRLGLSSDGFSPFRSMNITHSTWPVILFPYNLPPGECMKQSYFMLSTLVPGPSEPGNDIDVYLEPLIEELKELWDVGVKTYDVSAKQNFQLRAAVLWTVSDLPGLAKLSGWSTRGKYACPVCGKQTNSEFLNNSHKHCYMCHRVFLPNGHPYRSDKLSFDGKEEHKCPPGYPRGSEVLDEIKNIENKFGKTAGGSSNLSHNWKKKSIFFNLPYWESNLLRHNLDVMHIEKNVCDKVLYTLMNSDKSKDNKNARLDLKAKGIRPGLHPFVENGKEWLPAASFTLDKHEKKQFCKVLKNIKVPDGYAADISKCVHLKPPRIFGQKIHDSHILMQQLLPVALRNLLPSSVRTPIIHLCKYFSDICSKTLNHRDLTRMEKEIALVLCQLEKNFPPAFFDITVHLTIHLVTEAKLAGPVQYRWMYPIERFLSTLKSYVRNKGQSEGSIAEGCLVEETLALISLYFNENVETRFNRVGRNDEGDTVNIGGGLEIFSLAGRPLWNGESIVLDKQILDKAHRYVLFNCDEITTYRDLHESSIRSSKYRSPEHEIKRIHSRDFASWFSSQVDELIKSADDMSRSDIKCLARSPLPTGKKYKGLIINGFRFHTKEVERKRRTQNCGVMVSATTTSFASKKDRRPITSDLSYYGILKDIIELHYMGGKRVMLFECDWVSKGRRLKQDNDGFTLANFTNIKRHNELFVLASQVKQVFYVEDLSNKDWHVVLKTKARDKFEDGKEINLLSE